MSRPGRLSPWRASSGRSARLPPPDSGCTHERCSRPIRPWKRSSLSPRNAPREVLLSPSELPRNLNRAFPLEVPDDIRHRVLRRNADAYVHVVAHQVPFDYLRFLVRGQFVKHLAQMPTQHSEHSLLPSLRYENHVVFAVPSRMTQALVLFHRESPFSWQRSEIHADRRKGQTLVSPPAQPGAYLYELSTMSTSETLSRGCCSPQREGKLWSITYSRIGRETLRGTSSRAWSRSQRLRPPRGVLRRALRNWLRFAGKKREGTTAGSTSLACDPSWTIERLGLPHSVDGLSSQLFPHRDWRANRWASDIVNSPRSAKKAFGHCW